MKLYTIQIAQHRRLHAQLPAPLTDITIKSGLDWLAPTWDMVTLYKRGVMSQAEYERRYRERMRMSYTHYLDRWMALCNTPDVVIGCMCPAGVFCHRLILTDILDRVCKFAAIPFTYVGECTPGENGQMIIQNNFRHLLSIA